MSFGFPAYHEEYFRPRQLPDGDMMYAVAGALGWSFSVEQIGPVGWRWRLGTSLSFWSWGEVVIVEPQPDNALRVRSNCALFTQCFDWGHNRRNVQRLAEMLQV
jgi:hypothetical protein